ncbi:MAG: hypothetical protein WAO09_01530 [Candidatus Dormiibacterota bacterium]|jgi:hypothetical protein
MPVDERSDIYNGERMTARQLRRLKLLIVAGVLVTDLTFGFALHALGVSLLWCATVLAFLTVLSGGGNWLVLRSLRRSLDRASRADRP